MLKVRMSEFAGVIMDSVPTVLSLPVLVRPIYAAKVEGETEFGSDEFVVLGLFGTDFGARWMIQVDYDDLSARAVVIFDDKIDVVNFLNNSNTNVAMALTGWITKVLRDVDLKAIYDKRDVILTEMNCDDTSQVEHELDGLSWDDARFLKIVDNASDLFMTMVKENSK